jgi:hypothetical protein
MMQTSEGGDEGAARDVQVAEIFPKEAKLLVMDFDGHTCALEALEMLYDEGYENIVGIQVCASVHCTSSLCTWDVPIVGIQVRVHFTPSVYTSPRQFVALSGRVQ